MGAAIEREKELLGRARAAERERDAARNEARKLRRRAVRWAWKYRAAFRAMRAMCAAAARVARERDEALTREGEMFAQATERMLVANDLRASLKAAREALRAMADRYAVHSGQYGGTGIARELEPIIAALSEQAPAEREATACACRRDGCGAYGCRCAALSEQARAPRTEPAPRGYSRELSDALWGPAPSATASQDAVRERLAAKGVRLDAAHPVTCRCRGTGMIGVAQFSSGLEPCAAPGQKEDDDR